MTESAPTADPFRLFTVNDTGERLGIGAHAVYRMIYRGDLRTVKLGRSHRIREVDLIAWLDSHGEQDGAAA